MEKKELIKRLEDISEDLESLPIDATLKTAVKDISEIQDKVDDLTNEIEAEPEESREDLADD